MWPPQIKRKHYYRLCEKPFVLGDECELVDPKESSSVICCKHQDLESGDIQPLLTSGMIVIKLQLAWLEGISFTLDDQLAIKRLRFEDNIRDKADSADAESQTEAFDREFAVMIIELSALIKDLTVALGGVNTNNASVEEIVAKVERNDQLQSGIDEVAFG